MSGTRREQPAAKLPAERARQAGAAALETFWAALEAGGSHAALVPLVALQSFLQALRPALEDEGQATLVMLGQDFYLNDARIPTEESEARRRIAEEFRRRGIAGIRVRRGATAAELKTFFALFGQPDVYSGADLLAACTAYGSDRVLPAVDASIEAPDDNFEYDPEPREAARSTAEAESAGLPEDPDQTAPRAERPPPSSPSRSDGIDLRRAKRAVLSIVEQVLIPGAAKQPSFENPAEGHDVAVCRLAVSMARFLDLDRRATADLGVAALLHDVGYSTGEAPSRHPLAGALKIAGGTTLNRTSVQAMRVALEHHSRFDARDPEGSPSLMSGLVAVADCYASLRAARTSGGHEMDRHQALGAMLGPLRARFHPLMLWALVKAVGLYHPGQRVELDDGSIAEVVKSEPSELERPRIRLLVSADGVESREAAAGPLPSNRSIRRVLSDEESRRAA